MAEKYEEVSSDVGVTVKTDGRRRGSEEEIYNLLFQEVNSDGSGLVGVANLVDYLQKMQLGSSEGHSSEGEDVYDSHQDVHQIKYNLQLLKAMLEEVSGETKLVDETTYSSVIRLWVKDVRDRSNQQPSLEVSQLSSESEDSEDGVSMTTPRAHTSFEADQSFETSGGNSSTHSGFDMLASLEDVRLENRRLLEKEKQLQASLDLTEEQLRTLQTENSSLLSHLKGFQQQRLRMEVVERENMATEQSLKNEEMKCQQLTEDVQKMSEQLNEAQREMIVLKDRMNEVEEEREKEIKETIDYQQQLQVKEEMLCAEKLKYDNLQEQLTCLMAEEHTLRSKVIELQKNNKLLQRENEELNSVTIPTGPSYSTPFRSTGPPSLHEEISRHGNLSGQAVLSPLVGVENHHGNKESCCLEDHYDNSEPSISRSHGNLTLEDLEHIAQNSSNKFHSKTEVIVKVLSELMPSTSSTPHTSHTSTDSITEVNHDKRLRDNSNLRHLVACVKKLYSEKKTLKQQVAKLQNELEQKVTEDVDAAVQTIATPLPVETTPIPYPVINTRDDDGSCTGVISRVARGVVRTLYLVVVVTLLLATLVWLHEHLTPCCHGDLTPGGMVWSILQPHITVRHHGYI